MEKRHQGAETQIVTCLPALLTSITSTELTLTVTTDFMEKYGPPVIHI